MKPINTSIFDFPGMITGGYVYVDKTAVLYEIARADAALAQCRDRNYAARFAGESRPVYYVGVNYDPKSRTVDGVKAEAAC